MKLLLLFLFRYVRAAIFVAVSVAIVLVTTAVGATVQEGVVDNTTIQLPVVPTWEELDARPLPTWYDDAKFGIFIHWGVFSVPSFNSEWIWHNWQTDNDTETIEYIERTEQYRHFTYQEYAARFKAELYQPKEWAQVFAQSGAQYVVLTSKHHDGYCT
jgi:alpha-L-fucosidase